ncbi:MAG: acyl-CoA dehydrogenase, partial [Pseudomonadota bacterium]
YGEHDLADNIIHLVLARLPDAPEGVKGISLFIVPKILADEQRNDVTCISVEHKLGIHASPTCTMQFGDKGGAIGYLIGKENDGLKYMFTMMNNARLSVGLQGVAIADRALQAAKYYASERKQGKPLTGGNTVAIYQHPDIVRMLLTMESLTVAGRILAYQAAFYLDRAKAGDAVAQGLVDVMTPIVKSWCTDNAVEVASLGVQIHGGMGFIEETGAAQFYRDARILPIYEGTNGIQANDLVFRKVLRDGGATLLQWIKTMREQTQHTMIMQGLDDIETATKHLLKHAKNSDGIASIAVPYLKLCGGVAGAVMLDRFAKADNSKLHLLHFYTAQMLPLVRANLPIVMGLS